MQGYRRFQQSIEVARNLPGSNKSIETNTAMALTADNFHRNSEDQATNNSQAHHRQKNSVFQQKYLISAQNSNYTTI